MERSAKKSKAGKKTAKAKKSAKPKKSAKSKKAAKLPRKSKSKVAAKKKSAVRPARPRGGSLESVAAISNRAVLDQAIGAHWPGTRKLNPPFDPMSLAGLAAKIRALGVKVQTAPVQMCQTVQCVLDHMKSVNPGGG